MRLSHQHIIPVAKAIAILMVILLAMNTNQSMAQSAATQETKVKSVFLYNFTQFVAWPPGAFSSSNDPFVIGILGEDPFGSILDAAVAGEKVAGHPVVIMRYKTLEELSTCHILYIGRNELIAGKKLLQSISARGILTVSEGNRFAEMGGVISFIYRNNKIRLLINPVAARNAQLSLSSKLLSVSEIYEPSTP